MTPLYFAGSANDLGHVSALPQTSFLDLCVEVLSQPVALALTRDALHALPEKEQNAAKRVSYITAATFKTSPSPRQAPHAGPCNLIPLDVDDSDEAKRLLAEGFEAISKFGFIVWHTARSTPDKPRLRVMVRADALPLDRFDAASRTLMATLGLQKVVVFNPVQPMYLPVKFDGEQSSPVVQDNSCGDSFLASDINPDLPEVQASPDAPDGIGDLDYLRTPMEGVTLEDAQSALSAVSPDVCMADWIAIGMGLKHQFGDDAYEIWDAWSAKGEKYVDADETSYRWGTFKAQTLDRNPVTIRTLFKKATAMGWENSKLSKRVHALLVAWASSPTRSSEELLDHAASRIAKHASALSSLERKTVLQTVRDALSVRGIKLTVGDLNKEVQKCEAEGHAGKGPALWTKNLCFVTGTNSFFNHVTGRSFAPDVLDLMYGQIATGEEKSIRPRDYLVHTVQCQQVENLRYDPEQGKKVYFTEDNVPYVNTYRATYVQPDHSRANEAGDMYQEHLSNLIAESAYQRTYLSWQAYLVQHPGKKILWAPLVQGCEGCGKSFTAYAMIPVLGRGNVRKINAGDVMNGQYNDWAYGQQLVVMEEVRIVGANRHAVMDKLKPCISDESIGLHRKFEHHQTVKNTANYLMFTNHHDSLSVTDSGRRYFVLSSPLQNPEQVAELGGQAYFNKLFGMVRDNAGGLRAFFETYQIDPDFQPQGRAPKTKYLTELAEAAATPLAAAVAEALKDESHPLVRGDMISLGCLREQIQMFPSVGHFSDQALGAVLREHGFVKHSRIYIDSQKHQLWTKGRIEGNVRQMAEQRMELL